MMNIKKLSILVAALLVPALSFAWEPAGNHLTTRWGRQVAPGNAWRSYPRPQLQRAQWVNLNGLWDYAITDKADEKTPATWDGEILVPYCIESSLSGVGKAFTPDQRLWYKRTFIADRSWNGKDVILHFGAVDYSCDIFVNGKKMGSHVGGNNAFSVNITKAVRFGKDNMLVVSVIDPTDTEADTRGKQILAPKGIWYTAVSGIWKTVWMETVSRTRIEGLTPMSDIKSGKVKLGLSLTGATGKESVEVQVLDDGKVLDTYTGAPEGAEVKVADAVLWTPDTPKLYGLKVVLKKGGKVLDEASSYCALREVSKIVDCDGNSRFTLNGNILFQFGPLDQGWWPDGLLTPPSEEAMLYDMVQLKKMGCNTIRKHIKVEPELYYYYADSLGIMMWQDMVSGFVSNKANEQHVGAQWPQDWDAPASHEAQWKYEYEEMVDNLKFYPSITTWIVFNEGWGQFRTSEMTDFAYSHANGRLINSVTGWADRGVGDYHDIHNYPSTALKLRNECGGRISSLGEFGGLSLAVENHMWAPGNGWGYRNMDAALTLFDNYSHLMYDLESAIAQGLSSAIYTQTTDVETELNGFMTYDREVTKMPVSTMNILSSRLYNVTPAVATTLVERTEGGKLRKIAPDTDANYNGKFSFDGEADGLSLYIASPASVEVRINGIDVFEGPVRQTRSYNQFNISNRLNLLKKGENSIEFILHSNPGKKPVSFDYSLRSYKF